MNPENFDDVLREEIDRELVDEIVELVKANETFEQRWTRELREILKEENE